MSPRTRIGIGIALALTTLGGAPARADLRAKLKAGKIVVTSVGTSGVLPGRAMATVEASAEHVYEILTNIKAYPNFVPHVNKSTKLRKNVYELLAKFPWPVSDTRVRLRFNTGRRGKTYVLSWKMAEGTLEKYEGAAWIQPWGRDRCLLTYQMLAVPRIPAPSALMSHGLRKAVTKMVAAIRERATRKLALRH